MTTIAYFKSGATVSNYDSGAVSSYIATQKNNIHAAAGQLALPQIGMAIAGAMAEENHNYRQNALLQDIVDKIALKRLTVAIPDPDEQVLAEFVASQVWSINGKSTSAQAWR